MRRNFGISWKDLPRTANEFPSGREATMAKKVDLNKTGIEKLPNDKPVVYKISTDSGKTNCPASVILNFCRFLSQDLH